MKRLILLSAFLFSFKGFAQSGSYTITIDFEEVDMGTSTTMYYSKARTEYGVTYYSSPSIINYINVIECQPFSDRITYVSNFFCPNQIPGEDLLIGRLYGGQFEFSKYEPLNARLIGFKAKVLAEVTNDPAFTSYPLVFRAFETFDKYRRVTDGSDISGLLAEDFINYDTVVRFENGAGEEIERAIAVGEITLQSKDLKHIQSIVWSRRFYIDEIELTYIPSVLNGNLSVGDVTLEQNDEQVLDYDDGLDFGQVELIKGIPTKVKAPINVSGFDDVNRSQTTFNVCLEVKNKLVENDVTRYTQFMKLSDINQSGQKIIEFTLLPNYTKNLYDFIVTVDCNETADDIDRSDNKSGIAGRYTNGGDFGVIEFDLVQGGDVNPDIDGDGIIDIKSGQGIEIPKIEFTAKYLEDTQIEKFAYYISLVDRETNFYLGVFYPGRTIYINEFVNGKLIEEPKDLPSLDYLTLESKYYLYLGLYDPDQLGDINDYYFGNNYTLKLFRFYLGDEKKLDVSFDAKIGQVFQFDSSEDIELVQNKEADVLVTPKIVGDDDFSVPRNTTVEISAKQGTQDLNIILPNGMTNMTVGDIENWGTRGPIIFDGVDTSVLGSSSVDIEMKILGEDIEDEPGNNQDSILFSIGSTYPFNINFYNFMGCTGDPDRTCPKNVRPSFLSELEGDSRSVILNTYPIIENKLNFVNNGSFRGSPVNAKKPANRPGVVPMSFGLIEDMKNIGLKKSLIKYPANEDINRSVLLVSDEYFIHHDHPSEKNAIFSRGLTNTGKDKFLNPASIITDNSLSAVLAHELVHSFVNHDSGSDGAHSDDDVKNAYDAKNNFLYSDSNVRNYMFEQSNKIGLKPWIDKKSYKDLFNFFKNPIKDPEVLIISGILSRNGDIEITETLVSKNGVLTPNPDEGSTEITIVGFENEILTSFRFEMDFQLMSSPDGLIDVDQEPFVISLPYSKEIRQIEVRIDGELKVRFDPLGKSLVDAINSLDEESQIFTKRNNNKLKKLRKRQLLKYANKYEYLAKKYDEKLNKCSYKRSRKKSSWHKHKHCFAGKFKNEVSKRALDQILRLLKAKINRWVNESPGPLIDKSFILELIEVIEGRYDK